MADVPVFQLFNAFRKILYKVKFEVDIVDFTKYIFTVKFEVRLFLGVLLDSKFKPIWWF